MHIGIIGIGAMGSLFGAYLAQVARVTLIGHWPAQLVKLQQPGLQIQDRQGETSTYVLRATADPQGVAAVDLALICVKSSQTLSAANSALKILAPTGKVLTLQNGLGNLEKLTAVLEPDRVFLGITSAGATLIQAGQLRLAGLGHTYLASPAGPTTELSQLANLFRKAGFPTDLIDNPDSLVWGKLAVNAGINPLTALLRQPNGYLAENAAARQVMMAAAEEVARVARAQNINLPFPDAGRQALTVAQNTAANFSSMLQDVLRGVPTEIEAICGAVVAYGRRTDTPTPLNQRLYETIKMVEQGKPLPENLLPQLQTLISTEEKSN